MSGVTSEEHLPPTTAVRHDDLPFTLRHIFAPLLYWQQALTPLHTHTPTRPSFNQDADDAGAGPGGHVPRHAVSDSGRAADHGHRVPPGRRAGLHDTDPNPGPAARPATR